MDPAFDPLSFYKNTPMFDSFLPDTEFIDTLFFDDFEDANQIEASSSEATTTANSNKRASPTTKLEELETTDNVKELLSTKGKQGRPKGKRTRTDQQQDDHRKQLNRINAKKSRIRKKFQIQSLSIRVAELEEENRKLRKLCNLDDKTPVQPSMDNIAKIEQKSLSETDFNLVESLKRARSNYCLSDPNLPDNPIVFASKGFFEMTGFSTSEIIGKNCRLLQGPETSLEAVKKIRDAIKEKRDCAVTLLNYKRDGSPFWNQLFVAPLFGSDGETVVHYVGVQCEVTVPIKSR